MIEDYPDNALLTARVLESHGIKFLHAENGRTGLAFAREHRPDLVLLDLGLPDMDGRAVATQLRQIEGLEQMPIIVVTAWPPEVAANIVKGHRCSGYICKPIDVMTFAKQVLGYLAPVAT